MALEVLASEEFHESGFLGELRLTGEGDAFLKVQISNAEGVFLQGVHQEKDQALAGKGLWSLAKTGMGVLSNYICGSKEQA